MVDLLLFVSDLADQLRAADLLECKDLVEREFELGDEGFLVVFCPFAAGRVRIRGSGLGGVWGFEGVFEIVIVDIVVVIVPD